MKDNKENPERQVRGNIEGIYHNNLFGWFYTDATDNCPELILLVNGAPTLSALANQPRPDVFQNLGYAGNSGFVFDLSDIECDGVVELSVECRSSNYTFYGSKYLYCKGITKFFGLIRDLFYPEYYRCRNDLCHLSNEGAFQHFITDGIFNDLNPNPWFSCDYYRKNYPDKVARYEVPLIAFLESEPDSADRPSSLFDPSFYRIANTDLANEQHLLRHYVLHGHSEGRKGVNLTLPSQILEEFEEISALDPLIAGAKNELGFIVRQPYISKAMYAPRIIHRKLGNDIKAVVCVPFITRGGADLISTFIFKAYQRALGKDHVAMLVTDQNSIDVPEWLDSGSKVVSLDQECTFVNDEERLNTLHVCLGHLAPEKIINVNSHALWKIYKQYGVQLSSVCDLYAFLFCFDYNKDRQKVGYITDYLSDTIKCLKAVYFDNAKIISDIKSIYGLHSSQSKKLHTVYVPAAEGVNPITFEADKTRDSILWVGRLSLQKRPDILVSIAQSLPNQRFEVYGPPGNSQYSDAIVQGVYSNIVYRGVYNSVNELDYSRYKLYLNTSEWEGLPTIIIQMMAVGLPIVTSSVCGITELVNDENGWLIGDFEDVDEYVKQINSVLINKEQVLLKRNTAFSDVLSKHNWDSFYDTLISCNAFVDHDTSVRVGARHADRRKAA